MKQNGEVCAAFASFTKFAPCGSHLESRHHFNELLVPGSHLYWFSGSGFLFQMDVESHSR